MQSHPSFTQITLIFSTSTDSVMGISNVHITMPSAIQSGKNATLLCQYELDDDDLYSVKWYKGRHEFFRYTPKEIPSMKLFHYNNLHVDVRIEMIFELCSYQKDIPIYTDSIHFQLMMRMDDMG